MAKETGEFSDKILDLRVARWRRDPLTCEILEALETMSEDEKLVLADHVRYVSYLRQNEEPRLKEYADHLRKKCQD